MMKYFSVLLILWVLYFKSLLSTEIQFWMRLNFHLDSPTALHMHFSKVDVITVYYH